MASSSKKRLWALVGILVAALAAASVAIAEPAQIREKRAEAEQVLAQIQQIDADLELAVEAYNGATVRLDEIREDIRVNQRHLSIARSAQAAAQKNLSSRIVALYMTGDEDLIQVMLGSSSLGDLLDRIDSAKRISSLDVEMVKAVRDARTEIQVRAKKLSKAQAEQQKLVAEREAQRQSIESKLAERQGLLSSIKDQIGQLQAEERARQEQLRREAEQRLEAARQAAAAEGSGSVEIATPAGEISAEAPPPNQYSNDVVGIAMQFLGIPYVWGGSSPSGFDCSGLVVYVYGQLGISLPHYTGSLWQLGSYVSRDQLQPGDLVFFNGLGHVGIYIGGGQMIHAPHTGDVVKISDISGGYYAASYVGARRI